MFLSILFSVQLLVLVLISLLTSLWLIKLELIRNTFGILIKGLLRIKRPKDKDVVIRTLQKKQYKEPDNDCFFYGGIKVPEVPILLENGNLVPKFYLLAN